ncbi:MAG: hypothetical protein ACOYT4_02435 [Nanoarchaeota archaeon]
MKEIEKYQGYVSEMKKIHLIEDCEALIFFANIEAFNKKNESKRELHVESIENQIQGILNKRHQQNIKYFIPYAISFPEITHIFGFGINYLYSGPALYTLSIDRKTLTMPETLLEMKIRGIEAGLFATSETFKKYFNRKRNLDSYKIKGIIPEKIF